MLAQDQTQSRIHDPALDQTRLQTPIYGTPLMTNTEIALDRSQRSALKTPQERDAFEVRFCRLGFGQFGRLWRGRWGQAKSFMAGVKSGATPIREHHETSAPRRQQPARLRL